MILRVPAWESFAWLDHGFGTRLSEGWTQNPGRATVNQVHSDVVHIVCTPGNAGPGDALITDTPGVFLEVRTADCIPLLLMDPVRQVVAAVHAGWRGTEARIAEKTAVLARDRFGCSMDNLTAAIGPGIEECCFEVGPEVAERFGSSGRVNLNLVEINRKQLLTAGIRAEHIVRIGGCTRCGEDLYYSFRRDRESAGRMASAIGIRAA
jgi:YfiH family protein